MITRLVKLTFEEDRVPDFLAHFETIKHVVNNFPGCKGMQLLQNHDEPGIVFTHSLWESEEDLNNYRKSDAFGEIWPHIKQWFCAKPEAWTTTVYFDGIAEKK